MKNKLTLLPVLLVMAIQFIQAQSASMAVISPTGNYYANNTINVQQTIGEMAMVETFSNSSIVLTQGFQQPNEPTATGIKNLNNNALPTVWVYPNPTPDYCTLSYTTTTEGTATVTIFSTTGQIVENYPAAQCFGGANTQNLWLSPYAAGIYMLQLKITDRSGLVVIKNARIQIIK